MSIEKQALKLIDTLYNEYQHEIKRRVVTEKNMDRLSDRIVELTEEKNIMQESYDEMLELYIKANADQVALTVFYKNIPFEGVVKEFIDGDILLKENDAEFREYAKEAVIDLMGEEY